MKLTYQFLALSLLFFSSLSAYAEQTPSTQGLDTRVQIFNYDPSEVYLVNAKIGYSTLIQLEEGEVIPENGGLGMGDAKAWSLEVRANNIFFKPVSSLPDTNMILVTNKRTYAFQLTTKEAIPTYIARFSYPETSKEQSKVEALPQTLKPMGVNKDGLRVYIDSNINTEYYFRGDKQVKPTNAWDDGLFTYLKFGHGGDLPAVYRVQPNNTEALVNTHTEGDIMVIQEKGAIYRLRYSDLVGDVSTSSEKIGKKPEFNTTGTSDKDILRTNQ